MTLLHIEPLYANEIRRKIEATIFQFKSMEIGLWKINIFFNSVNINLIIKMMMISEDSDIWISGSNTISYVICEFLINTILEHNEVDEIKYGNDKQKL